MLHWRRQPRASLLAPINYPRQNDYITVRTGKEEHSEFPAEDDSDESDLPHLLAPKDTHINITRASEVSQSVSAHPEREPYECLNLLSVTSAAIRDAIKWDILTAVHAGFDTQELSDGVLSLHVRLGVIGVGVWMCHFYVFMPWC